MKKAPHDKNSYRKLLNLQNAWDDEDVNNVSHERIDVNREEKKKKKQWLNSKCKETVE